MPRTLAPLVAVALLGLVASRAPAQTPPQQKPLGQNAALQYWMAFSSLPESKSPLSELTGNWETAPLEQYHPSDAHTALAALRRAAAMPACDWGIDYSDGPNVLLPHLGKARELARLGLLDARWDFAHGKTAEALDDLRAVLVLSRYADPDGLLIGMLVQVAIESMALQLLADNFAYLTPQDLDHLEKVLAGLPPAATYACAIGMEKKMFVGWLRHKVLKDLKAMDEPARREALAAVRAMGGDQPAMAAALLDPEQAGKIMDDLEAQYDELVRVMGLPYEQYQTAATELDKKVMASGNPLLRSLLPAISKTYPREAQARVQRAMVRAAIAYRRGGAEAAGRVLDPVYHQPFTIRDTPERIEVVSKLRIKDKPVTMAFAKVVPATQPAR